VLCLFQIASDIRSFLVILLMVMLGFASMFYLIDLPTHDAHDLYYDPELEASATFWPAASSEPASPVQRSMRRLGALNSALVLGEEGEEYADADVGASDAVNEGFVSPAETLTSIYRLMLGDFERDWFDQPLTLVMFFVYTFLANIMMLNVLIAVVSDSYECAIIKSKLLFRRARLELVAEFDTMLTICSGADGAGLARHNAYAHVYDELERADGGTRSDQPTAQLTGLSWAVARLSRPLARAIKMGTDEEDGEDNAWPGRALDMEKRVAALIEAYEERASVKLDARLEAAEARIIDSVRRMHRGQL